MADMKKLTLALFLACATVQAQFNCTTNQDAITITAYTGPGGAVVIPDTVHGLPVTSIGDSAFANCQSLTSVTIPNCLTNIGDSAFSYCRSLTTVAMGTGLCSIGGAAFFNCSGLTHITLLNHGTRLGYMAFWNCKNLTNATFVFSDTNLPSQVVEVSGPEIVETLVTQPARTHWRNLSSSYADLYVEPFLPQFGYACEVGANDGVRESNTLPFENKGWKVLCIEPNPLLTQKLSQNRKLWRAVACGSERVDDMEFVICGIYPYDSSSGFHTGGAYPCPSPKIVHVKVLPLRDVLEDVKFPRLDLLSIDVEGHELEVLKGMDFTKWHPKFVIVEDTHNAEAIREYLASFGYESWHHCLTDNVYGLSSLKPRLWKKFAACGFLFVVSGIGIHYWFRRGHRNTTTQS